MPKEKFAMALLHCPDCGRDFSSRLEACPTCCCPAKFAEEAATPPPYISPLSPEGGQPGMGKPTAPASGVRVAPMPEAMDGTADETVMLAMPPVVPVHELENAPRFESPSTRSEITARDIYERRNTRRHTSLRKAEDGAAAEPAAATSTSGRTGWEDIEEQEEKQRSGIHWGGVILVVVLLALLIGAGLHDYNKRKAAREAEEALLNGPAATAPAETPAVQ